MPRKAVILILLSALMLVAIAGCATQNPPAKIDKEDQARIEKALKNLKDKDAYVRRIAVFVLDILGGKEYAKNIVKLLKDEDAGVRGDAVSALGKFEAKEYADEIKKLINDSGRFYISDEAKKGARETTVSAEAERVLKEWGVDVEKLKERK